MKHYSDYNSLFVNALIWLIPANKIKNFARQKQNDFHQFFILIFLFNRVQVNKTLYFCTGEMKFWWFISEFSYLLFDFFPFFFCLWLIFKYTGLIPWKYLVCWFKFYNFIFHSHSLKIYHQFTVDFVNFLRIQLSQANNTMFFITFTYVYYIHHTFNSSCKLKKIIIIFSC